MSNPILSICIPTYNRAEYLEDTILSIVKQQIFIETSDVEIVISDNCSIDNTQEIGLKYSNQFPQKIRYYRNSENIKDANFEKVLTYGRGKYLKINNDTLNHKVFSLEKMVESIGTCENSHRRLVFTNGALFDNEIFQCENLDEFVQRVSSIVTWIGSFGILKSDFDKINDFSASAHLQLTQAVIMLREVAENGKTFVDNRHLFITTEPKNKGGYNIFKVFVNNYFDILEGYVEKKMISKKTLYKEKKKFLKEFLFPWLLKIVFEKDKYSFETVGGTRIIFMRFKSHPYFYKGLYKFIKRYIAIKREKARISRIKYFAKILQFIYSPNKAERHSRRRGLIYTFWKSKNICQVGNNPYFSYPFYLYGGGYVVIGNNFFGHPRLRIEAFDGCKGVKRIVIGNDVSINYDCHIGGSNSIIIGNNVLIGSKVLITDHSHGEISAHAFKTPPALRPIVSKGPVIIEDNVWIGEGVAILPGVTLGKNCIIGANSVVTRSVPANSVACGNPARIVKIVE